jgi:hypothetical protein
MQQSATRVYLLLACTSTSNASNIQFTVMVSTLQSPFIDRMWPLSAVPYSRSMRICSIVIPVAVMPSFVIGMCWCQSTYKAVPVMHAYILSMKYFNVDFRKLKIVTILDVDKLWQAVYFPKNFWINDQLADKRIVYHQYIIRNQNLRQQI